jgi:hypothetical protein
MLSGAPENPNEAVSLSESKKFAEDCGIPNVAFISDACRSLSSDPRVQRLQGGVLFPSKPRGQRSADVDMFLAARIGTSALEVAPAGDATAAHGIFTASFLEAYKNPYPAMVQTIGGRPVVPNRRLKGYLEAEVPKRAQALSVAYNQMPDSKVQSADEIYIAHVSSTERATPDAPVANLTDVARVEIASTPPLVLPRGLQALRNASGFEAARNNIVSARPLALELTGNCGFTITGARVARAVAGGGSVTKVVNSPQGSPATSLVEVEPRQRPAASVAIRFENGTGTVLAALRDFVGNVIVQPDGVKSVSYGPGKSSPVRSYYEGQSGRLQQLQASVATAAQFGVFRFEGSKAERANAASSLANRIRVMKGIDPTLGLYAAYAYDEAGMRDQARSVEMYMKGNLDVDLFDVAMLAGLLTGKPTRDQRLVPCCPMLSQGWGLLRALNVQLPERIATARDHLQISLWNWLDAEGMDIIEGALSRGEVI